MTLTEILGIKDNTITKTENVNVMCVEISGGYSGDYVDSYIDEAEIFDNNEWRDATDEEIDILNEDESLIYESALKQEYN